MCSSPPSLISSLPNPNKLTMKAESKGATTTHLPNPNPSLFQYSPPSLGALTASCTEKLILHCVAALESNDTSLAQQVMWVLNNVTSSDGDPNQRLASWFLKALAARLCPNTRFRRAPHPMSVTELACYIDLTPWHRFGFSASNGAILRAVEGRSKIHIVDFGITHCMQWPTLIDALAKRPEGPPSMLRITVPAGRPPVPPVLNVSLELTGHRLANFARSRNVPLELHVSNSTPPPAPNPNPNLTQELACGQLFNPTSLDLCEEEAIVVNCQSWLRYLSSKDAFLDSIRALNPDIMTVTDEDADLDSLSLTSRIMACFNYLWIPFDVLETFLPKDSPRRAEYEADVGQKIKNIVGFEGEGRIERSESSIKIAQRMKRAKFTGVAFGEEIAKEVKRLVEEHAGGWGVKREEEMMVLTWKGHSSVFTSAWVPTPPPTTSGLIFDE